MRHQWASVHELARIGILQELPGETLGSLAEQMQRQALSPGQPLELKDAFTVVLTGLVTVVHDDGSTSALEPGDSVSEPGVTTLRTVMPSTIATCDRSVYNELVG